MKLFSFRSLIEPWKYLGRNYAYKTTVVLFLVVNCVNWVPTSSIETGARDTISPIGIPCKILERMIKKAILNHLQRNNLISDIQHGFLPGRSCYTNLLPFMDSLTQARDDGLISDAIFFDFSKAFDKVPHKPLLHKLQTYGGCGELLQWTNSFLTDRSFCVKIDQTLSSPAAVHSSVPHGSVLGTLLFPGLHKLI